jgi:hypothetical protein
MASTLKINTLTGVSTAGSIAVTGEGNSTTTNLQQGLAKAWVNFDGTASGAAERDSFNVSGMTDNGTGDYIISINNDMANTNYCMLSSGGHGDAGSTIQSLEGFNHATGQIEVNLFECTASSFAKSDRNFAYAGFFGDLA